MNKKFLTLLFTLFLGAQTSQAMEELSTQPSSQARNTPITQPENISNTTSAIVQQSTIEQQELNNIAFPQIQITEYTEINSRVNEVGKAIIESIINEKAKTLKPWQKEKIQHCALTGNFEAYSFLSKFWGFIGAVSYPLANLAQLVNSVLPLLSFGLEGENFTTKWKIAISLSGVLGLFLDKVSTFAYDTAGKETTIYDILQLIKARQNEIDNVDPLPLHLEQTQEA